MPLNRGNHCSEETLLCFLDRELSVEERGAVDAHLAACWLCRARLAELERAAQEIAGVLSRGFISPDRADLARQDFLQRRPTLERQIALERRVLSDTQEVIARRPSRWSTYTFAAAAAALVISIALLWKPSTVRTPEVELPSPASVLSASSAEESRHIPEGTIAHQEFDWRIEARPASRSGALELWTDAPGRRYAARLAEKSEIIHAVWRPGSDSTGDSMLAAFTRSTLDRHADRLRQQLLDWVEARPARPLLLAGEFADFCRANRLPMSIEREAGGTVLRITARKRTGSVDAEFTLEVDAATSRPLRQILRLTHGGETVRILLRARRSEALRTVDAAIFRTAPLTSAARRPLTPSARPEVAPPQPIPPTLADRETEIRYLLHSLDASGEPDSTGALPSGKAVDIASRDGRLHVRILVPSSERQDAILAALAAPVASGLVDLRIRIAPEPGGASDRPARSLAVGTHSPLAQAASRHAIGVSADLFAHAWGLARLAERYDAATVASLGPESRHMLTRMIRDHLAALQRLNGDMRGTFSPVMPELPPAEGEEVSPSGPSTLPSDWRTEAFRLFHSSARVHDLSNELITRDDPAPAPVRQGLADLALSLNALSRAVRDFDLAFGRGLQDKEVTAWKE